MLEAHKILDGAKVVAQVQAACRLNSRKDASAFLWRYVEVKHLDGPLASRLSHQLGQHSTGQNEVRLNEPKWADGAMAPRRSPACAYFMRQT